MTTSPHLAAILLAAGKGTRMRSARPKLAHELAGRPLIHYPLRALARLGAEPTVVVVGYEAGMIREACAGFSVRFAEQAEQRGTGHAVLCGLPALEGFAGELLLLYGDLPLLSAQTLGGLVEAHRQAGAAVSLLTAHAANPFGFGRIVRQGGRVVRIVEQRDATAEEQAITEVNVGIYCVDVGFLRSALPRLQPDNAQGELYLTDIIALAVGDGRAVAAAPTPAAEVAQVNSRGELAEMEKALREQINQRLMEAGVTLLDPDTAYIEAGVEIGVDTIIGPNVQLRGATKIGARCRLDGTALIRDTVIGDDTHIKLGVVVSESEIGAHCDVGPFAQLRPGTKLADRVSIGNFVETKKARISPGTKARHLSYLGDVDVGSDSNIGAGTIVCNYDGFRKSQTVIGSRVMIGSDSQLIAPVTVGDDAYVATGTTVRKNVGSGALVFNSRDQLERPGWVAARRTRGTAPAAKAPAAGLKLAKGGRTTAKRVRTGARVVKKGKRQKAKGKRQK